MANIGSIDTDAAIGTILGHFSSDYVLHVVGDSLDMRFRPYQDEMSNMVDVLERQFNAIYDNSPDYTDKVLETKLETYKEIINIICRYYNLTFTGDYDNMVPEELYGVARSMYDIFISRFTFYMIDFFVRYIVNNMDDIYNYLVNDPNSNKPKDNTSTYASKNYMDSKFIIIHANINQVIYNMASYDIPLSLLMSYFRDPIEASVLSNLLVDNGDIYKNYYASFILDRQLSASVITNIKLELQGKTQEIYKI